MPVELYGPVGGANLTAAQTVQTQNCVDVTLAGNSTSAGAGYILISSGTMTLAGGANVTLSQNGNAVTVIGGAGGAFSGGVSSGGNTAGTTGTVGNGLLFFGGSNITLSQSSAAGGASISVIGPDNQTFIGGIAGSNASTVTNGTVQFANSNGLTFGLNGSTITASHNGITSQSVQTQGSVLVNGSSGSIVFAAGNLMSFSTNGSTLTYINLVSSATNIQEVSSASAAGAMVSRFANEGHVHPGVGPAGVSNIGNTAGATGALMGRLMFAGGNNITLSVSTSNNNAQTITISAPNAQTGISGFAASGASTVTAGTVQFANSNGLTFGLNGSTITGSYSQSVVPLVSRFHYSLGGFVSGAMVNGTASFQMVQVPYPVSFSRVDIPVLVSLSSSATPNTANILISSGLVIYTVSNGATLDPIAGAFGTTTHTWASNTANFNNLSGPRVASFPIATTLSAGVYYVGFQLSTANTSSIGASTTALANSVSILYGSAYTLSNWADFGAATNATTDLMPGIGLAASTITGTAATQGISNISATGASKLLAGFQVLFRNF